MPKSSVNPRVHRSLLSRCPRALRTTSRLSSGDCRACKLKHCVTRHKTLKRRVKVRNFLTCFTPCHETLSLRSVVNFKRSLWMSSYTFMYA
jgi:hypothetical protein